MPASPSYPTEPGLDQQSSVPQAPPTPYPYVAGHDTQQMAPIPQPGYLGYWPAAPHVAEPPRQIWSVGKTVLAIVTAVVIACGAAVAVAAVDKGSASAGGAGSGNGGAGFGNRQFGNGRGQFGGTGTGTGGVGNGQAGTTHGAANGLPAVGGN